MDQVSIVTHLWPNFPGKIKELEYRFDLVTGGDRATIRMTYEEIIQDHLFSHKGTISG